MYKLTLCRKYLLKRGLAYFAVFAVTLCVWMMVICVSVLTGFVNKIEVAAKGLFGDVVVSSASLGGVGYYDAFIEKMRADVPEVEGASPFILTFGILRVPGTDYRRTVQVAGIRLPERAEVSDFEDGLFIQKGVESPTFDPGEKLLLRRLEEERRKTVAILNRLSRAELDGPDPGALADTRTLAAVLGAAAAGLMVLSTVWVGWDASRKHIPTGSHSYSGDAAVWIIYCALLWVVAFPYYLARRASELRDRGAHRTRAHLATLGGAGVLAAWLAAAGGWLAVSASARGEPDLRATTPTRLMNALDYQHLAMENILRAGQHARRLTELREQLVAADDAGEVAEIERLERMVAALERVVIHPPQRRAILGLGIPGLTSRTARGETIRTIGPGHQVVLSLLPLGRRLSYADITPVTRSFTVIDDCSTDVSSIDSEIVYLPFQTLQRLNNMSGAEDAADATRFAEPARCSQIHVKVRDGVSRGAALAAVAAKIDRAWAAFKQTHPDAARTPVVVETWRQRQSRLVSAIENQRTLMVIILSIISAVALVLIFVIMYVIVVQKTRDIGVLKAVGASSGGVASIFLGYGAAIGLVGSVIGAVAGCLFVWNINAIHDWIGRTFGFVVWNRETFMFEKIPSEVSLSVVATIVGGAILSGVIGSLFPAVLAGAKQPVEALRYE